jgi:DNA-directed RNA polymerase subunit RPC12/RpoP
VSVLPFPKRDDDDQEHFFDCRRRGCRRCNALCALSDEDGRTLRCRECGEPVLVFELPTVWLAEDAYVCGNCLRVVDESA